jgi:hypothetical protein
MLQYNAKDLMGLLKEITGWQRNRLYRYEAYLILFQPLQSATPQDFSNNNH